MSEENIPYTVPLPGGIPNTHRPHTERTTTILVPKSNTAFLNPVQEYNRDLSVSVIRAWNELRKEELETRWKAKQGKKSAKAKAKDEAAAAADAEPEATNDAGPSTEGASQERTFRAPRITILEALSATGLRSIRYAKEIPDVKVVLANDLSPSACDAMRRNVSLNGVGEPVAVPTEAEPDSEAGAGEAKEETADLGRREGCSGYVRVNEGDAIDLMQSHRHPKNRVDVVDLDPYGTAAPFVDSAIGCIADGGLLAVTCTDLAVLAGSNYPEKCFSNYGGAPVNAEYSHEVALRLVLNSLAQAAARYQRVITPLLSFSIDFYVRLFVRVDSKPVEVKKLQSTTGVAYACGFCQTPVVQPFGRILERQSEKGHVNKLYRTAQGPAEGTANGACAECGAHQHLAGPMWLGSIHDPEFVGRVLKSIDGDKEHYGTWPRMHGMLSIAHEELPDPFYFSSNKIFGFAHSTAAPTKTVISALLNAGYKISRSHALSGSVKTNAPRSFVYDIVREFIKTHPVRMDKVSETSPTRALLAKPMTHTIDLSPHPGAKAYEKSDKVVFYQVNPLPNWGPGSRARTVKVENGVEVGSGKGKGKKGGQKRKSEDGGEEGEKRAKVAEVEMEINEEDAMNS